jgi:hypothetical protein
MPFIRGRYHINPVAGQALEAAREAEAALLAQQHQANNRAEDQGDGFAYDDATPQPEAGKGPIHRVEIEAAELVPSHSGRAQSGFVARVQRHPAGNSPSGSGSAGAESSGGASAPSLRPETHVFSDHHDLVSFLRDEFAKDCASHSHA